MMWINRKRVREQNRIQFSSELEEGQEKMSVEGEKKKMQQMWSDGKMRWEDSRWKQKRETEDTEYKVREVQSRRHGGASPAERN